MIMWVYATFGMTAILVVGAVLLAVMYSRIKAFVLPYLKCYNRPDKTLMLIFERKGTVRASPGDYVSEMYEDTGTKTPLAFFKADTGGFKLGNVDVEVFYDGADVTTSPELLIVVEELKGRGYRNIEEVMRAVRSGTFGGDDIVVRDGVVSMDTGTILVPILRSVNPGMVEGYSRGKPAITRAYTDTVLNIDRAGRNQKFYENPQIMALGFILIAGCLGIGILKSLGVF